MDTSSAFDDCMTLTFNLGVDACKATAAHCMSTISSIDSSSRFMLDCRQTDTPVDRQTHIQAQIHRSL